jgi:bifunctional DNA-binding transcriptional regulator/antitoxin component of YhaV-PrlF toxin-antitoxin module
MTVIVKASAEDVILIPAKLLAQLNLQEGDEVKAFVEGNTLRLQKLDDFLSLGGALANDAGFDEAMQYLEKAWQAWTPPDFA